MQTGSAVGSQAPDSVVSIAGRYRVLSRLARGGMGEVFAVLDTSTDRRVALKRMLPTAAGAGRDRSTELHFMREYHALAELRHPRIIEVYDYGVEGDLPYYTMELLDGQDLRDLAPLPYREACRYLHDVASSLALLHARRLLHRDLSPRNVRCTSDGRAKLLDFGTMIPFGAPRDVAGTPPCIPLEAMQGAPLDQRADLYALGALGYWLLTGTHARDARTFEELPKVWQKPLIRPKRRVEEIPDALDELIVSLLQLNPAKRPNSVALVMEVLSAIGELPTEDSSHVAQSFLTSTQLVGRDEQLTELGQRFDETIAARGGALLITGETGSGRSRLLHEACLAAQTHGLVVVRAQGRGQRGGQTLARDLFMALCQAAPEEATQAHADTAEISTWLERTNEQRGSGARGDVNNELRSRLQSALDRCFCEVARSRPLLLAVDDLDRADEFSISLLTSIAQRARELPLSIVMTHRSSDDSTKLPAAFDNVVTKLAIANLDRARSDQLVGSLFGEAQTIERVSDWLFRAASGNPGLTLALAQHLFLRGVLHYAAGSWVLPSEEISEPMPDSLAQMLVLRIERLQPAARALAELLSLRRGSTSVELCVGAGEGAPAATFAALEELVSEGVLQSDPDGYGFTQEAMRDAIGMGLSTERRQALHARLANALLTDRDADAESRLEAGFHLVHTADELAGADLLSNIGSDLVRSGLSMATALPALEKALDVYERHGRPLARRLRLRSILMRAAWIFDYQLERRHGDETVRLLYEHSGLALADRWAPRIGRLLALGVGICHAEVTRWFKPRAERGPSPALAIIYFARTVSSLMGVYATALDGPKTDRLWQYLHSFGALPKLLGARPVYSTCLAFTLQPLGVESRLHLALQAALNDLRGFRGLMRESERQDLLVGLHLADGINECYKEGSQAIARADALEKLGTQLAIAAAHRIRMVYYVVRSDRERAEHYQRMIDLHGIQGGTTWQVEWFSVPVEGMVGAFLADTLLARRSLVRLERLIKDVPSLVPLRDMVRIAYHYRRGDYERAVILGEAYLERTPPRSVIGWAPAYASIAVSLIESGQYQRAREVTERGLAAVSEADRAYFVMYTPLDMAHAAALFMLGHKQEAEARFQATIERLTSFGEHSAIVLLHEMRSRISRLSGDREGYLAALDDLRRSAVASRQPSAVMFADRIASARTRFTHGSIPAIDISKPAPALKPVEQTAITSFLSSCTSEHERSRQALRLLAEASDSQEGYLYLLTTETPQLVASLQDRPPSHSLAQRIASVAQRRGTSVSVALQLVDREEDGVHTVYLLTDESGGTQNTPVGAAVLRTNTGAPKHVQVSVLRDVARMLMSHVEESSASRTPDRLSTSDAKTIRSAR